VDVSKILLVDDDMGLRRLVRLTLGPDYDVIEANDGEEAVEITQREHPDLVFMDIRMPRLSGYEACRRIKENPETANTKVVILTANMSDEDRERGAAVGADGYLTKPYSPLALLAKVEELVGPASA
jgi:CheY-like chemotaxis protein